MFYFRKIHFQREVNLRISEKVGKRLICYMDLNLKGSTETRTRIFGFKVQGANHYTIEPDERFEFNFFIKSIYHECKDNYTFHNQSLRNLD